MALGWGDTSDPLALPLCCPLGGRSPILITAVETCHPIVSKGLGQARESRGADQPVCPSICLSVCLLLPLILGRGSQAEGGVRGRQVGSQSSPRSRCLDPRSQGPMGLGQLWEEGAWFPPGWQLLLRELGCGAWEADALSTGRPGAA